MRVPDTFCQWGYQILDDTAGFNWTTYTLPISFTGATNGYGAASSRSRDYCVSIFINRGVYGIELRNLYDHSYTVGTDFTWICACW